MEDIQKYLPTCDFIAFDEEMSGIFMDGVSNSRADTANQRYTKMCKIAKRFSIIQFGIALFTKCDGGGYVSRPYNFYLFPTKAQDIVLSASAIGFLKKHGMDFQKVGRWCIRGGKGGYVTLRRRSRAAWLGGGAVSCRQFGDGSIKSPPTRNLPALCTCLSPPPNPYLLTVLRHAVDLFLRVLRGLGGRGATAQEVHHRD